MSVRFYPKSKARITSQKRIKIWPVAPDHLHFSKPSPALEKPLILPKISNPLTRIHKALNKHTLSSPIIKINHSVNSNRLLNKNQRISGIDDFIKTCEAEKHIKTSEIKSEINRSEQEISQVVNVLESMKRKKKSETKRKRENEFYITRVQMKKMIEDLRVFTKHIGY